MAKALLCLSVCMHTLKLTKELFVLLDVPQYDKSILDSIFVEWEAVDF